MNIEVGKVYLVEEYRNERYLAIVKIIEISNRGVSSTPIQYLSKRKKLEEDLKSDIGRSFHTQSVRDFVLNHNPKLLTPLMKVLYERI